MLIMIVTDISNNYGDTKHSDNVNEDNSTTTFTTVMNSNRFFYYCYCLSFTSRTSWRNSALHNAHVIGKDWHKAALESLLLPCAVSFKGTKSRSSGRMTEGRTGDRSDVYSKGVQRSNGRAFRDRLAVDYENVQNVCPLYPSSLFSFPTRAPAFKGASSSTVISGHSQNNHQLAPPNERERERGLKRRLGPRSRLM